MAQISSHFWLKIMAQIVMAQIILAQVVLAQLIMAQISVAQITLAPKMGLYVVAQMTWLK